ncbi:MAG: PEP-CTERM sorting domain-containing protein [Planctomycetota bacterium]
MSMRWLSAFVGLAILALCGGMAQAVPVVIDFESGPAGTVTTYTESGATFTATDGGTFRRGLTPNNTQGLLGSPSPYSTLRADIAGGTTAVSVDLGDYNQDSDTLFLEIFTATNVSVGYTSQVIAGSFTGMKTLSLSHPSIAYAVFGATDPALGGSSVYADNFTFESSDVIPEPATLSLLGLGGLALLRRRRRR